MASSAGFLSEGGRIPGEIIGTPTIETSDSGTFNTTETAVLSVTVPLVSGRTYSIHTYLRISSTVDNDDVRVAIREDSASGAFVTTDRRELDADNQGSLGQSFHVMAFFTATATEDKTFVTSAVRDSGTGTYNLSASANRPSMLYVRYEFG
jgi:hypothetical protein